jgi:hypothetical protein
MTIQDYVQFVKNYASNNNLTYPCAASLPEVKRLYKQHKKLLRPVPKNRLEMEIAALGKQRGESSIISTVMRHFKKETGSKNIKELRDKINKAPQFIKNLINKGQIAYKENDILYEIIYDRKNQQFTTKKVKF